jgi:hypothetical protein
MKACQYLETNQNPKYETSGDTPIPHPVSPKTKAEQALSVDEDQHFLISAET